MENKKNPEEELNSSSSPNTFSRRDFIKVTGSAGLFVFFTIGGASALSAAEEPTRSDKLPTDFNAFLRIDGSGSVTCYTGKIEMGQGINTSLAQMLADELDVSFSMVKVVLGDTDICPFDQGTWGSMTTRFFGPPLRAAAAEAREILLGMASEKLGIPKEKLSVKDGVVSGISEPGKKVTYGQLTEGRKIEKHLTAKPGVKDYSALKVSGKPELRVDSREKVTGKAVFIADLKLPGMLYARIVRPPAHGSKLVKADFSEALKVEGISTINEDGLAAVLHKYPDVADRAVKLVKAEFTETQAKLNNENLYDNFLSVAGEPRILSKSGDVSEGEKNSPVTASETFYDNYLAHSPIEPHAAAAMYEGGKLTVWVNTQTPFGIRRDLAGQLNMKQEDIRIVVPFIGGGFGGKIVNYQALEAAKLAKLAGRPVMVALDRKEEFFYDVFHPASMIKIKAGLNEKNELNFWDYSSYFAGDRGASNFYEVPNQLTKIYNARKGSSGHDFPVGAWRAPNNNTNTFARESFIDLLSFKAGMDPLEFRLKNLKDKKFIELLETGARKFGYTPASKFPGGRGFGMACGDDAGSAVAMFAEVDVNESTGKVTVKKVTCAQNMGMVINPQGATIQMEGCITMGLGYALTEEVKFSSGRILNENWDTYDIPKFSWLPEIETVIMDKMNEPPQGGGEPAIIAVGAAIGNAIFDKTGARVTTMPFTPERVLKALAARQGR